MLRRRSGAGWVDAIPRRRSGGGWVVAKVRRRQAGAWVQVWPLALVGSSPGVSGSEPALTPQQRNNTISVSGGYGPYTYSTTKTGGAASITLSNANTANPTASSTGAGAGQTRQANFQTTVTDSFGDTHTHGWTAYFEWY